MIKRIGSAIILFLFVGLTIILVRTGDDRLTDTSTNVSRLSSANDCRMIQHTMGETCVPKNPKRVAPISHNTLGNALTLGIKLIATGVIDVQNPFPEYLKDKIEGIEVLGLNLNLT